MFSFDEVKDLSCFLSKIFMQRQSLVITSTGVVLKYFMNLVMIFDIFFTCVKFRAR